VAENALAYWPVTKKKSFICLARGGLDGGAEGDDEKLEFIFFFFF
jgi:hypothetical protein